MSALFNRRLFLSHGCRITVEPAAVVLSTRDDEYRIATPDPRTVELVMRRLRQPAVPASLATTGLAGTEFEAVLALLHADGLLLDVDAAQDAGDREATAAALSREARFWARPIFEQPFWHELLGGSCTPAQVLGWGVEFYHFVDAANAYMPLGVAHTRSFRHLRRAVARHYVEEMDHGKIFLDGLARSGVDRASVLAAPPLPHTRALVNHLAELAYEGEVPYAAAFAVMQPGLTETTVEALDTFYGRLATLYPFASGMFEAFRRHAGLDVDLRHDETIFALLCREDPGLAPKERARASLAMQTVAEAFTLFFEGILDAYREQRSFVPRRQLVVEATS